MVVHLLQNLFEKKNFLEKIFVFFTKYTLFAEKNNFIWKKRIMLIFFLLEKLFLQKMKIIYISFKKYFFIQKIYIHSAKNNFLVVSPKLVLPKTLKKFYESIYY